MKSRTNASKKIVRPVAKPADPALVQQARVDDLGRKLMMSGLEPARKEALLAGMPMLPGMSTNSPLQSALKVIQPKKTTTPKKEPKNMGTPQGKPKISTPQMPPPTQVTPPAPAQGTMKSAELAGIEDGMEKAARISDEQIIGRHMLASGIIGAAYGGHDRYDRSTKKPTETDKRFKYRRFRNVLEGAAKGGVGGLAAGALTGKLHTHIRPQPVPRYRG